MALFDPARLIAYHDVATPDQSDINPVSDSTAWSYVYGPLVLLCAGWGLAYLAPRLKLNELLTHRR